MACSKQARIVPSSSPSGFHETFLEALTTQNVCLEVSRPFCSIQRRLVSQALPERHTDPCHLVSGIPVTLLNAGTVGLSTSAFIKESANV